MGNKLFLGVLMGLSFDRILIEEGVYDKGYYSFVKAFDTLNDKKVKYRVDLIKIRVGNAIQELLQPFYIHCLLHLKNFL